MSKAPRSNSVNSIEVIVDVVILVHDTDIFARSGGHSGCTDVSLQDLHNSRAILTKNKNKNKRKELGDVRAVEGKENTLSWTQGTTHFVKATLSALIAVSFVW